MSEKVRIQREVGARVVRLLGLREDQIRFVDEHPDAGGPDAIVALDSNEKIIEMTRADPEASGALTDPVGERGYLSGAVRGPLLKLWNAFRDLDESTRRFDTFLCFHNDRIPQGQKLIAFMAELTDVITLIADRSYQCANHYWHRDRWVARPPYGGRSLLSEYCSRIELDPDLLPHGGQLSTNHDSHWGARANITRIVERKAKKRPQAHWLVIFEWEIWGAVPDLADLVPLNDKLGFERIFILKPIGISQLIEWDGLRAGWVVVASDLRLLTSAIG